MIFTIDVPDYDPDSGVEYIWQSGFEIKVSIVKGVAVISANREGLISLATHLLALAQDAAPLGSHLHLDENNSLEDESAELILEKI